MKTIIVSAAIFSSINFLNAQQIDFARNAHFTKSMDELTNGKAVLKYSDIKGSPFYKKGFENARIGETNTVLPVRYNMLKDQFEILNDNDIYAVPKDKSFAKFVFVKTNEKFVLDKDKDSFAGYFLVLIDGPNKLLKKSLSKFSPEVPAPNSMIAGMPAKFENLKPEYYIKTEDRMVKLSKKQEDLINALPEDKKDSVKDFIKSNKIKMTDESDLIKLVNFLNK